MGKTDKKLLNFPRLKTCRASFSHFWALFTTFGKTNQELRNAVRKLEKKNRSREARVALKDSFKKPFLKIVFVRHEDEAKTIKSYVRNFETSPSLMNVSQQPGMSNNLVEGIETKL